MANELQWLTEKHYLVCPKGAMFKQMKVTSQNQVTFSGNLAATTADTMKANVFICLGSMAFMAGAIAGLLVAALALMAVPVAGWAMAAIIGGALLLAIGIGYMKCKTNAASRRWINSSPNLIINHKEGLVVGQSQLFCPPEGAMVDIKPTFWEAMMSTTMNDVGHIANFAFGFLAGRGMGSMAGTLGTQGLRAAGAEFLTVAKTELGSMFNPASLLGKTSWLCRSMNGLAMVGNYKAQYDVWSDDKMSVTDKLMASGQDLILAIFAAKGASLVCFPAGTAVHTSNGLVGIEEVAVGTLVWTVNESTGDRELKPVTVTHRRTTLSMMVVELENGTIFEVTPEHRFLIGSEWKEIQDLEVSDEMEGIDGEKVRIRNIGFISKSATVYNFDVLDNENYFVTEEGVLVHNGYQSSRLPRNKGKWVEGTPGNGLWKSDNPKVNAITGGKPVPFKNGRPDFSEWKVDELKVEGMNGTREDFSKIHEKLAEDLGLKNKTAAEQWLKDNKLTAHHLDNETIELVPSDLHNNIPHKGSASDMRELFGL